MKLRPLDDEPRAPAAPPRPTQPPPSPPPGGPTRPGRTGGRFASAAALLDFLGMAAQQGVGEAVCRRRAGAKPGEDAVWWAEVDLPWERGAALVGSSRGVAFVGQGDAWREAPAGGPVAAPTGPPGTVTRADGTSWRLDPRSWLEVEIGGLVSQTALATRQRAPLSSALILAPGRLGPLILRQARAIGLDVHLAPATREPLGGGEATPGALLRVSGRVLAPSWWTGIGDLPGVVVAAQALEGDPEACRVWVDARALAPTAASMVGRLVPAGETWVLGLAEAGHWRVRAQGPWVDAAALVHGESPTTPPLVVGGPAFAPRGEVAHLVPAVRDQARADAIVLEPHDISTATTVLRRLADRADLSAAAILPGPDGRALLVGPGSLLVRVPCGVALTCVGPGAIYRPIGRTWAPPMPAGARWEAFGAEDAATVVTEGGALRFLLAGAMPAWRLWLAAPSAVVPLGEAEAARVRAVAATLLPEAPRGFVERVKALVGGRTVGEREQALAAARVARVAGRWQEAAAAFERAGDFGEAGRMYEKAAGA
jgi:hypothetical protein